MKNEVKKEQIYNYLNNCIEEYGVCPSVQQIADDNNCSKSTAHKFLVRLEEEGKIERIGAKQIITVRMQDPIVRIPLLGYVSCGVPKLAEEQYTEFIPVSRDLIGEGDYFALIADGDSMIKVGINRGDIVIVRKQNFADDGQIVVATMPDECSDYYNATLKRFYRDQRTKKVILHPENDNMEDMIFNDIIIQGVAVRAITNLTL